MMRVLTACNPASDAGFGERVRDVVARDTWDLASPEGVALVQAVLRETYPLATVTSRDGVWSGGVRRTSVLDVHRDGLPGANRLELRWPQAVYDQSGASVYRAVVRIVGEGERAEQIVEEAFRSLRGSEGEGSSIVSAGQTVEVFAIRLAQRAQHDPRLEAEAVAPAEAAATPALAEMSLRKGAVRRSLRGDALSCLISSQREALELSLLENLKVRAIADRMQTTPAAVHRHLTDALLAVDARARPSPEAALTRWRDAERSWAKLPVSDPARSEQSRRVAHAWLYHQVATRSIRSGTVVLVTDISRRFVTANATAGVTLARPSMVGLQIDDITAEYGRPLVPELWDVFDTNGSMSGEYDCDRPGQTPIRFPFHGFWGRPLPDLQVGYLNPGVTVQPS